ncbi:hypothetical protein ACU686_34440 [Yinghuangia aomiensis]
MHRPAHRTRAASMPTSWRASPRSGTSTSPRSWAPTRTMNPTEVRNEFLTPDLNAQLDAWAEQNGADPIFRAQNVPVGRGITYEGSGAGHATVVVTQQWSDGSSNDVWYSVPLDGSRIDGLEDPPA